MPRSALELVEVHRSTVKWIFDCADWRACCTRCFSKSKALRVQLWIVWCSVGSQVLIPGLRKKRRSLNSGHSTIRNGIEQREIQRTRSCSRAAGLISLIVESRRLLLCWLSSPRSKADVILSCWELACCTLLVSTISWLSRWRIMKVVPPDSLYCFGQYLQC